jgi:hypothetical protein
LPVAGKEDVRQIPRFLIDGGLRERPAGREGGHNIESGLNELPSGRQKAWQNGDRSVHEWPPMLGFAFNRNGLRVLFPERGRGRPFL